MAAVISELIMIMRIRRNDESLTILETECITQGLQRKENEAFIVKIQQRRGFSIQFQSQTRHLTVYSPWMEEENDVLLTENDVFVLLTESDKEMTVQIFLKQAVLWIIENGQPPNI